MSTKSRNQFSNGHASKGQQPSIEKGEPEAKLDAKMDTTLDAKVETGISPNKKFHDPFGAPHFPPSENLPPQAKRLAMIKKKKAQEAAARKAEHLQAKAETPEAPRAEQYPDALPRAAAAKAAVTQTWTHMTHESEPVIKEAKGHLASLREAATKLWAEASQLVRTPAVLFRVLMDARRA
jgi:hypothetical protein